MDSSSSIFEVKPYEKQFVVRSYEADFNRKLRITALFNYLQEIAWENAEMLDFGWNDLNTKGCIWALSRIEVDIQRLPLWSENIRVVTWARPAEGIFALRDFEFYDSDGNKIVSATSSWLVINADTRRPLRIAEWYTNRTFYSGCALGHSASKISDCSEAPLSSNKINVHVADIDMNQHVNNVCYIDWAYNTFSIEHYSRFRPCKVAVNFNAECRFGDEVEALQYKLSENNHIVAVNRLSDSKNLCKLEFWWQPID